MPATSPRFMRDLRRSVVGLAVSFEADGVRFEFLVSLEVSLARLKCELAGLLVICGLTLLLLLVIDEIGFIVQLDRRFEVVADPLFLAEKIVVVVVTGADDVVLVVELGVTVMLGECW